MQQLQSPQGTFSLLRFPRRKQETLRAWDAADEYLLQQLHDEELLADKPRTLIINDQFGALAVCLNELKPQSLSDSYLAHAGIRANLRDNGIEEEALPLSSTLEPLDGTFDLVLIKVPKSLAMLEDQLHRIRPHLHEKSRILGAGMVKSIHTSTLKLFESIIGDTRTSLARKKARLIFSTADNAGQPCATPYPSRYVLEGTDLTIANHAGVFSRDSLDIGTRFFLQHLPQSDQYGHIIDLGCGNGVVGVRAAQLNPEAKITFADESFMATDSARINFEAAFGDSERAEFHTTDCLAGIAPNSADLILNNPPFHQQNVVGTHIARQMFRESHKALKAGGELWVIGNRHLGYHVDLKKRFGNCETIASNKKFVILRARRER